MTKAEEKLEWEALYEYVKSNVLMYDSSLKFPKYLVLRLKGLATGKFMANKNQKPLANYSYKEILLTFKIAKSKIDGYLFDSSKFKNEEHKINGIMIIVEKEINDVVLRLRGAKKNEEKIERVEIIESDATYVIRPKKEISDRLKKLW